MREDVNTNKSNLNLGCAPTHFIGCSLIQRLLYTGLNYIII